MFTMVRSLHIMDMWQCKTMPPSFAPASAFPAFLHVKPNWTILCLNAPHPLPWQMCNLHVWFAAAVVQQY